MDSFIFVRIRHNFPQAPGYVPLLQVEKSFFSVRVLTQLPLQLDIKMNKGGKLNFTLFVYS